ncbi:MAG TPA: ComEC/Rec2 family competence protein [bacterium]|nr:ComEC/Rec2 family competence protein [bacterium]HOL47638.1 ComEC/Rec2 family competence protein [bacterium]HPQ19650.1 ComEC/Rec2 family competence protein [bacterium]
MKRPEDKFAEYRKKKDTDGSNFFRPENLIVFGIILITLVVTYFALPKIKFLLETKTEEGRLIAVLRENKEALKKNKNIIKKTPGHCLVTFIDVGQGDASLIETPNGKVILIDGGEGKHPDNKFAKAFNAGERVIIPMLWAKGIKKIDIILISHAHSDHIGGLLEILDVFPVDEIIEPGYPAHSANYSEILKIAKEKNIKYTMPKTGDILDFGKDVFAQVLWVDKSGGKKGDNINNTSIVLYFKFGNTSIIFSGDAEKEIEEEIVYTYGRKIKCDIYKVGHHGSRTSSSEIYVKIIEPKVALIGVGSYNTFGHPTEEILKRLASFKTKVYRTDKDSHIYIDITENDYKIITAASLD